MKRTILIHFNKDTGEITIEAEGFEDLSCLEATQPFEEALGLVSDRTYKPESVSQLRNISTHQQYQRQ